MVRSGCKERVGAVRGWGGVGMGKGCTVAELAGIWLWFTFWR